MTRRTIVTGLGAAAAAAAQQPPGPPRGRRPRPVQPPTLANGGQEKRILAVLEEIEREGRKYLGVPIEDGRMLRLLTETAGAKNVVEIGTSTGYSGLWLCLAMAGKGGKLTTFEIDSGRASTARQHFDKAGVGQMVESVVGDAHQELKRVKGPVDVVFIDAEKEGYPDYLRQMLPLLRPRGLILAHNIDMVREYVDIVAADPNLETIFYLDGGGLGITMKKT